MNEGRTLIDLVDNNAYVRDMHSKALLPKSRGPADEYLVKTKMLNTAKENSERINALEEKVNSIESNISEILKILRTNT